MSIGLDTSVVLRLLTGLPEPQFERARAGLETAIAHGEPVFVTDLVLAETYFALVAHYEMPKTEARRLIHAMITSKTVDVEPGSAAVAAFGEARGPGPVDRLIHGRHTHMNASTWTFDDRLRRLPNTGQPG